MANDKQKLFERAKQIIKDKHCFFIKDVTGLLGVSAGSFYEKFPAKSVEMEAIKELLAYERSAMCVQLRAKMFKSKSDTATIALYKLICSDEERAILNNRLPENENAKEGFNIDLKVVSYVRTKDDPTQITSSDSEF